jgi:hypothetical protein
MCGALRAIHPRSHDFAGGGTNHREAKDAIVATAHKSFHKALSLIGRLGAEYRFHRQPCDARHDPLTFRFTFTQSYMGKWWISEHAIWNQPITRAAVSSRQIVTYDSNPINLTSRASLIPFSQLPDSPQKQALERSPFNFSARATIPVHSWQPPTSALMSRTIVRPLFSSSGFLQKDSSASEELHLLRQCLSLIGPTKLFSCS